MSSYPFDFTQYCVTDEPLVGLPATDRVVYAGAGEVYVGLYNFNPGFNGTIKTISFKTTVDWANPDGDAVHGSLFLKARKYTDTGWTELLNYSFDGTTDLSGEVDFNLILVSGESSALSNIGEVPLLIAITGYLVSPQEEEVGDELIINYDFTSGEDNWTLSNTDASFDFNIVEDSTLKLTAFGAALTPGGFYQTPTPRPGATSDVVSVNNTSRYKLVTSLSNQSNVSLSYTFTSGETSGVIIGFSSATDAISTHYITFAATGNNYLKITQNPRYNAIPLDTVLTTINSISLREVTQEEIQTENISVGRNELIVRCMGETL